MAIQGKNLLGRRIFYDRAIIVKVNLKYNHRTVIWAKWFDNS